MDIDATKKALDEALKGGLKEPVTIAAVVAEAQPARKIGRSGYDSGCAWNLQHELQYRQYIAFQT